jgi:hypothetical protein
MAQSPPYSSGMALPGTLRDLWRAVATGRDQEPRPEPLPGWLFRRLAFLRPYLPVLAPAGAFLLAVAAVPALEPYNRGILQTLLIAVLTSLPLVLVRDHSLAAWRVGWLVTLLSVGWHMYEKLGPWPANLVRRRTAAPRGPPRRWNRGHPRPRALVRVSGEHGRRTGGRQVQPQPADAGRGHLRPSPGGPGVAAARSADPAHPAPARLDRGGAGEPVCDDDFLWHQTALIAVTTFALGYHRVPGLHATPDTASWVLHRLAWLPVFAVVLRCVVAVVHGPSRCGSAGPQPRRMMRAGR